MEPITIGSSLLGAPPLPACQLSSYVTGRVGGEGDACGAYFPLVPSNLALAGLEGTKAGRGAKADSSPLLPTCNCGLEGVKGGAHLLPTRTRIAAMSHLLCEALLVNHIPEIRFQKSLLVFQNSRNFSHS